MPEHYIGEVKDKKWGLKGEENFQNVLKGFSVFKCVTHLIIASLIKVVNVKLSKN